MPALAPELEVLISTITWLLRNGWNIEEISVARGYGLPPVDYQKKEIEKVFSAENAPFEKTIFKPQGQHLQNQ